MWLSDAVAIASAALDFIFPPVCLLCEEAIRSETFCPSCTALLEEARISDARCALCGLPIKSDAARCPDCSKTKIYFREAFSPFLYKGAAMKAVHALKYNGEVGLAAPLGRILARSVQERRLDADVIVPAPLHPSRLRRRGFNQSLLIARETAKLLDKPLDYSALKRIRATGPQTELAASERAANVKGAFEVIEPTPFKGRTALLIDDVMTTGSTVNECSRALLDGGAAAVFVVTVARAG